ncbi:hypothetical protein ACHAWO_009583 [Cyclotella atomus]|uniref:C2 domain-containing protein n=1 Tax=Cyclotella atomus TaxID=382360 RepID=A0ABD3MPF5_9STRA
MSEPAEAMTPTQDESPTTVTSKVPFDAPAVEPPKMEESKPSRMNFLRRSKVKSRDEDEEDDDEAEIKRLEKKVELLKKKKQLVMKIKKIERGIETGEPDSDEDTATPEKLNKQSSSPKRWPALKPRLWRRAKYDSDDELTYDDDDSPLLNRFHSALDCIESGCDPIFNEIVDLDMMCMNNTSKERDESLYTEGIEDTETVVTKIERNVAPTISAHDEEKKTDDADGLQVQVASLAAPIMILAKTVSQNLVRTDENVEESKETGEESEISQEKLASAKNEASDEKTAAHADEMDKAEDNQAGWIDRAASVFRSHSFAQKNDDNDLGLDCFAALSSQPRTETANEQSSELDAKFSKVTVTALALSGLSITSKKVGKSKNQDDVPPVQVVLSVIKNEESTPFVHIPSMSVVKDPSRATTKKNLTKYHVMGVWDIAQEDSTSKTKSSVSFSRLVGLSTLESNAKTKPDKEAEMKMSPSMIHLRICIKRDGSNELLPIGVAKVLVSGGPRNVELAVPLRPEYYKSMDELVKKLSTKPPESRWMSFKTFVLEDDEEILTCARFKGFKNESYRLEKDSFVRINLTVAPEAQDKPGPLPVSSLLTTNPFPSNNERSEPGFVPSKNDDAKSTAEGIISNAIEKPSSETEVMAEKPLLTVDESKPAEDNLEEKTKKSWFRKNKKSAEAETNEGANKAGKDDDKLAGAAFVAAAGGAAAVALTASTLTKDTSDNSDQPSTQTEVGTEEPSFTVDECNTADEKFEDKANKSWFRKNKKAAEVESNKEASKDDDKVAGAAVVGAGTAASVALTASSPIKNNGDNTEQPSTQTEVGTEEPLLTVDENKPANEKLDEKAKKSWFRKNKKAVNAESNEAASKYDDKLAGATGVGAAAAAVALAASSSIKDTEDSPEKSTKESEVGAEETSFALDESKAAEDKLDEKAKKSWFKKNKKAAEVESNESASKDGHRLAGAAVVVCGGSAAVELTASSPMKNADTISADSSKQSANPTKAPSSMQEDSDADAEETVPRNGSDLPSTETESASPSNRKKSWFKRGNKANANTNSSVMFAAAAIAGTGAVALAMAKSHEQQSYDAISDGARATADAQDELKEDTTHHETEVVDTLNEDEDSLQPVGELTATETSPNKNKRSWFKRGEKVKPEPAETSSNAQAATEPINDAGATLQKEIEVKESSFDAVATPTDVNDATPTEGVTKNSKKSWLTKSKKVKNESTKEAELSSNTSLVAAAGVVALAALELANDTVEPSDEPKQSEVDTRAPSLVDGIEAPTFKRDSASDEKLISSTEKQCEGDIAPKRSTGWFNKSCKSTKIESSQADLSTDANESGKPELLEMPTEMASPEKFEKANGIETSQASTDDAHAALETELIFQGGAADESKEQATNKSKKWGLKSLRSRKRKDSPGEVVEGNGAPLFVGAAAAAAGAAVVVGVGLKNQNIFGSDTSFEVLQSAEDERHLVVDDVEDVETPCFCNINEMMETDMPTNVAEGASCIKESDVSVASEEFEKTEDLYADDSEVQDNLIDSISVVNDMEQDDGHYDLSECSCEVCLIKRDKSYDQLEEECEGIELELKPKLEEIGCDADGQKTKTPKSLRKVSGLAGKLSRSKSRRVQ